MLRVTLGLLVCPQFLSSPCSHLGFISFHFVNCSFCAIDDSSAFQLDVLTVRQLSRETRWSITCASTSPFHVLRSGDCAVFSSWLGLFCWNGGVHKTPGFYLSFYVYRCFERRFPKGTYAYLSYKTSRTRHVDSNQV